MWTGNGDPTTPGYPSTNNAPRLNYTQTQDVLLSKGFPLPTIPIQPLGWGDAQPLLRAIAGPVGPAGWQGGLNFTYHIGPGPAQVHVQFVASCTHFLFRSLIIGFRLQLGAKLHHGDNLERLRNDSRLGGG